MDRVQFVVIRLGEEFYGINIEHIENIVRMQHITRVPLIQKHVKGVINLRGEVIPVMSLRVKMGMEEDEFSKFTRIIILKLEQQGIVGFIVDQVKEVVTLDAEQIDKITHENAEEKVSFVCGVGKVDDGLISILDLSMVVLEQDL